LKEYLRPFGKTILACCSVSKRLFQRRPSYLCLLWRIDLPVASGNFLVSAKEISPINHESYSEIQLKKSSSNIVQHRQRSLCQAKKKIVGKIGEKFEK